MKEPAAVAANVTFSLELIGERLEGVATGGNLDEHFRESTNVPQNLNRLVASVDASVQLLRRYLDEPEIAPLISVLEAIVKDPKDDTLLARLSEVFGGLGILQGAVLTYAPYIAIVLSDDPFGDPWS